MNKKLRESLAASYEDRKKQRDFFNGLSREDIIIEEEPKEIPKEYYYYYRPPGTRSGRYSRQSKTFGDYYGKVFRDSYLYAYSMKCGNPRCPLCYAQQSDYYNENTIQGEVVEEWPEIEA